MILIINTTDQGAIEIILAKSPKDFIVKKVTGRHQESEKLLKTIEDFLKSRKVSLKRIKAVGVVSGPGGFTALRIGVVIANTLVWALKIPIIGLKKGQFKDNGALVSKIYLNFRTGKNDKIVMPAYDRKPNITMSK